MGHTPMPIRIWRRRPCAHPGVKGGEIEEVDTSDNERPTRRPPEDLPGGDSSAHAPSVQRTGAQRQVQERA